MVIQIGDRSNPSVNRTLRRDAASRRLPLHSRRYAARMRELTASNGWRASLRAANQPFDRRICPHHPALRAHYAGKFAGQLAH
ncbi:MAG: hypothetical protein ACFCVA_03345 [Gammaproteobacteria bacterium]